MTVTPEELKRRFTHHPPTVGQMDTYEYLRDEAHKFARLIVAKVPESREQSLALTKLEEVVMHANAGIARRS